MKLTCFSGYQRNQQNLRKKSKRIMDHRKIGRHVDITSRHCQAMFRKMTTALIKHKLISITLVKAEEISGLRILKNSYHRIDNTPCPKTIDLCK